MININIIIPIFDTRNDWVVSHLKLVLVH